MPHRLASLLLTLAFPLSGHAELKLPQSPEDYRELAQMEKGAPCTRCGIVTDVRSAVRQPTRGQTPAATPSSGIGSTVATTPIVGSGSSVKDARKAARPVTYYKLSVRFDDGTFAFFEQDEQPTVAKGETVEVVDGRVVPRATP